MMKKIALFCILTLLLLFCTLAASAAGLSTVYLRDGGTGDGTTADTAVGTLADAFAALDLSGDCRIVVCGRFTQTEDFVCPAAYTGVLTVTSFDGETDHRENAEDPAVYAFNSRAFVCSGDLTFEDLTLEALETGFLIVGQHHAVTLSTGLSMSGEGMTGGTVAKSFSVLGGYDRDRGDPQNGSDLDTDITVLSGNTVYVVPFSRNVAGDFTGTAHIYIGGTASLSVLHGTLAYPSGRTVGDVEVTLADDAAISAFYGATQNTDAGSFILHWTGGTIGKFQWVNDPKYKLNYKTPPVLYAAERAAATRTFDSVAAVFPFVTVLPDGEDETDLPAPPDADAEKIAAHAGEKTYRAFRFAAEDAAELSFRKPDGTPGYLYRLSGDFWYPESTEGLLAPRADTTYVYADEPLILYGDTDGDGRLGVADALLLARQVLGGASGIDLAGADLNGDGKITLSDVLRQVILTVGQTEKPKPEEEFDESAYRKISVEEYTDRTKLGLLAQFVGFLSGYEFARNPDGTPRIAMPDDWYELCNGPYAEPNVHNKHTDKLLYNEDTKLWEVWSDDDYSIDILNQYILRDSFAAYGTETSKAITEGWTKYNVWDMGGGNRVLGAYRFMSQRGYFPYYAGNTEFGNNYSVNGEPYIENETLGMNAAGMPVTADRLATMFGLTTSEREPITWLRFFAAMYSMAYFETDVPTLIAEARKLLPEDCWEQQVIDGCIELHEKYPDDWRQAVTEAEKLFFRHHYDETTVVGETGINCSFILLGLLYGDGDFALTCKIISLAGHGGDSTTPVGLGIVGVLTGWDALDAETKATVNEKVWQDGRGVVVNLPLGDVSGYWMYSANLPERIGMSDLLDLYRENFEHILLENGGHIRNGYYYIPLETLTQAETPLCEDFEDGLSGWESVGAVSVGEGFTGDGAAHLTGAGSRIMCTLSGLSAGELYRVTAFVRVGNATEASLSVGDAAVSACDTLSYVTRYGEIGGMTSYVKRELLFTATGAEMPLTFAIASGDDYAEIDDLSVVRVYKEPTDASVSVKSPSENGQYTGTVRLTVHGQLSRETMLTFRYRNQAESKITAAVRIDGVWYTAIPLVPTGSGYAAAYLPLVTKKPESRVEIYIGKTPVEIPGFALGNLSEQ